MKNLSKIICAAALISLAAAGCKKKDDDKPAEQPKVTEQTPPQTPPEAPAIKTAKQVLDHHLKSFGEGNMDELLADYTDDAVMITPMGTLKGKEALKGAFAGLFEEFAKPGMKFELQKELIKGDVAYIVWSGETADNTYELATDTFLVKDGKIVAQTFAAKITPKNPPADEPAAEEMKAPAESPTQKVVGNHLDAFGKGDVEMILSDYNADSSMLTPMGELTGTDKLKEMFTAITTEFAKGKPKFEMSKFVVEGDVAFIMWTAETEDNIYELGTDTFIIVDGKIATQTFAAKITPKKS